MIRIEKKQIRNHEPYPKRKKKREETKEAKELCVGVWGWGHAGLEERSAALAQSVSLQ